MAVRREITLIADEPIGACGPAVNFAAGTAFQFRINSREDHEIFAKVVLNLVMNDALRYTTLTGQVSSA